MSVEHLIYCHPVVVILLCKLFNFFVSSGHIPASFAASESYWGLACGANLWFGGFPYTVYLGRPEWSKVQTRGKPLVATAQAKYMSAGEQ